MSLDQSFQERLMRFFNEMHFDSQPVAAKLYKGLILSVAIISYIIAYFFQRFSICIYSILAVTIICVIVVVPGGWSWWKRPMPKFAKEKASEKYQNQIINMIGKLSLIILVHCIYSLLRYRKYLLASQQPMQHLPVDIIVEILFGVGLGIVSILSYTDSFKNLRQFVPVKTYDASFTPKNLGNFNSPRAQLFLEILKQKHSTEEFLLK